MKFLVLCLVSAILFASPWRAGLPVDPIHRWLHWLGKRMAPDGALWLAVAIGVPVLLLGIVLSIVRGEAYGLFTLLLHSLVLIACVSRTDPLGAMTLNIERAWERGDHEAASLVAERDWSIAAEDASTLGRALRARVTWETFDGYFAPAFWYLLLGPLAALGYRLTVELARRHVAGSGSGPAAEAAQALQWIPLRLVGLSLLLVGRTQETWNVWRNRLADWDVPGIQVASEYLEAALAERPSRPVNLSLKSTRRILVRAILVWAVVIAVFSVLG